MAREETKTIYQRAGLGNRVGYGKHPALLVIDMQVGFTAPEKSPLAGNLDSEVAAINKLLDACRSKDVPVLFTVVAYEPANAADAGLWTLKAPSLKILKTGSELCELDPRLKRKPEDIVITKQYASSFFGTHLASTLTSRAVDTLIVTGCTTSGCVRATAIDAISHGFRPIVPAEGVGDRAREAHDNNLFDIDSKYGDVVPVGEVVGYLKDL